jgi:predicted transcriptional regulator
MESSQEHNETIMNFMRLLGNAERLKIAGLLGVETLSAAQIAERLGMKPAAVQSHLQALLHAGLVRIQGESYMLEPKTLELMSRQVLAQSQPKNWADEFEGEAYERKVLSTYIAADGTLKALPSQNKKMMVVAQYLVKIFEPGVRYPEKQVNEMLRRYHDDTATLRRYMVDNKLLAREKGEYWRV